MPAREEHSAAILESPVIGNFLHIFSNTSSWGPHSGDATG